MNGVSTNTENIVKNGLNTTYNLRKSTKYNTNTTDDSRKISDIAKPLLQQNSSKYLSISSIKSNHDHQLLQKLNPKSILSKSTSKQAISDRFYVPYAFIKDGDINIDVIMKSIKKIDWEENEKISKDEIQSYENSLKQNMLPYKLRIAEVPGLGNAIFLDPFAEEIPENTFLGFYAGNVRAIKKGTETDNSYRWEVATNSKYDIDIDAREVGNFTRLLNHSESSYNVASFRCIVNGVPQICFKTSAPIKPGQMLLINYGSGYVWELFDIPKPMLLKPDTYILSRNSEVISKDVEQEPALDSSSPSAAITTASDSVMIDSSSGVTHSSGYSLRKRPSVRRFQSKPFLASSSSPANEINSLNGKDEDVSELEMNQESDRSNDIVLNPTTTVIPTERRYSKRLRLAAIESEEPNAVTVNAPLKISNKNGRKFKIRNTRNNNKKEYKKRWYIKNRYKICAQRKEHYADHRLEILKRVKIWNKNNKEKTREYKRKYNENKKAMK